MDFVNRNQNTNKINYLVRIIKSKTPTKPNTKPTNALDMLNSLRNLFLKLNIEPQSLSIDLINLRISLEYNKQ